MNKNSKPVKKCLMSKNLHLATVVVTVFLVATVGYLYGKNQRLLQKQISSPTPINLVTPTPNSTLKKSEEGTVTRYRPTRGLPPFELYINNDEKAFVGYIFVEGSKDEITKETLLGIGRLIKDARSSFDPIELVFYKFYDKKKIIELSEAPVSNYSLECQIKARIGNYNYSKDKGEKITTYFDKWDFLETNCDN